MYCEFVKKLLSTGPERSLDSTRLNSHLKRSRSKIDFRTRRHIVYFSEIAATNRAERLLRRRQTVGELSRARAKRKKRMRSLGTKT